jgi:hypothetical protein
MQALAGKLGASIVIGVTLSSLPAFAQNRSEVEVLELDQRRLLVAPHRTVDGAHYAVDRVSLLLE